MTRTTSKERTGFRSFCGKNLILLILLTSLLTKVTGKSDEKKAGTDAGEAHPPKDTRWHFEHFNYHTFHGLRAEKIGHPFYNEGKTQGGEKDVELEFHN